MQCSNLELHNIFLYCSVLSILPERMIFIMIKYGTKEFRIVFTIFFKYFH